jgi:hypothetical protein
MILRIEIKLWRLGGVCNIRTNLHPCKTHPCLLCVWKCVGEKHNSFLSAASLVDSLLFQVFPDVNTEQANCDQTLQLPSSRDS